MSFSGGSSSESSDLVGSVFSDESSSLESSEGSTEPVLSSSWSESWLFGRTKYSSSDPCDCSVLAFRTLRWCLGGSSILSKSGEVGTHIRGPIPRSCLCLQWSRIRKTSPIWILDGSFHSKRSGVHSSIIQDDGSFTKAPHGMISLGFLVTYPKSHVSYIAAQWLRERLTDMGGAIIPEQWLNHLGFISIRHSNCGKFGASVSITYNRDWGFDCPWEVLFWSINNLWNLHEWYSIIWQEACQTFCKALLSKLSPLLPEGGTLPVCAECPKVLSILQHTADIITGIRLHQSTVS